MLTGIVTDSTHVDNVNVAVVSFGAATCDGDPTLVLGPSDVPPFGRSFAFGLDDSATIQAAAEDPSNVTPSQLIPVCNPSLPVFGATGMFNWGPISAGATAPDPKSAR